MSKTAWRQTRPHSLKHIDSEVLTRKPTALNKSHSLDENVTEDIPDTDSRNETNSPMDKIEFDITSPTSDSETATTAEAPGASPPRRNTTKQLSSAPGGIIPGDIINLLRTLPFFSGLDQSEEFIDKISKVLSLRKFQTGDVVINQGETAKAMFFIIKGVIQIISDDGEIQLAELSSGYYFGEIGILFEVQRTATGVAKTPCTLLTLTREKLSQELNAYPTIRKNILSIAQTRLLNLAKHYEKSGKMISKDITRQIAELGIAAEISTPLTIDQTRTHWLEDLKSPDLFISDTEEEPETDPEDMIAPMERKDLFKPITSANILSKKLTEKRRASVAVWSDAKLMAFAKDIGSQIPVKESRFATSSLSISNISNNSSPTSSSNDHPATARVGLCTLNSTLIARIFRFLNLEYLNKCRGISKYFFTVVTENENNLYSSLNLTPYSKNISDEKLLKLLQFTGSLVMKLLLKNCWPITDSGLNYISLQCPNLVNLDLSGAWNITDSGLLKLTEVAENLESVNFSNCRKITDFGVMAILKKATRLLQIQLSYCKNLTGKVMDLTVWHSIREVNFQRATGIRDDGFINWSKMNPEGSLYFALEDLNLSDCSFLTDAAIQVLGSKCPKLKRLCLSFCCSLTEKFATFLSEGCPFIQILDTSYCGAAVNDEAVKVLAQGLPQLHSLGLRGCILLTDQGIEHLATHALALHTLNFTQCKFVSPSICKRLGIEWNCISTPIYTQKE